MLDGVSAVLFDEFHERSLDADLGLALARDVQQACARICASWSCRRRSTARASQKLLGDAPVIASEGRAFTVETRYVGRDTRPIEPQLADTIIRAMRADTGSLLAFLPGAAEIRRTKTLLESRAEPTTDVVALYGALTATSRIALLRRPCPAAARSCWRRRSPRPRSPSRACASSSIAGSLACRATNRTSA